VCRVTSLLRRVAVRVRLLDILFAASALHAGCWHRTDDPEEITLNAADRAGPPERQPLGEAVQKKNREDADCGVDNVVADEQRHRQAVGIVEEVGNDARPPVAGDHAVVQPLGRKRKHRNVGVKKALVTENPNGTRTLTTVESSTLIGSLLAAAVKNPAWPETERS
jgi:hypothetical protein